MITLYWREIKSDRGRRIRPRQWCSQILITVATGKCRDRTLLRGAIAKFKLLRDILEANRSDNGKRIDPSSRIFVFFTSSFVFFAFIL